MLLTSFLVFPRFACVELQDRLRFSLDRGKVVLELLTCAFMATHKAHADTYLNEADAILLQLESNLEAMIPRVAQSALEPQSLVKRLLRGSSSRLRLMTPAQMYELSSAINWHFLSMTRAARHINFNEYHALAVDVCRESFMAAAGRFREVIDLISQADNDFWSGKFGFVDVEALEAALVNMAHAVDHAYKMLSDGLKHADGTVRFDNLISSRRGPGSTWISGKGWNIPDTSKDKVNTNFDEDASPNSNRMSVSYYLFHLSELVNTVQQEFQQKALKGDIPSENLSENASNSHDKTIVSLPEKKEKLTCVEKLAKVFIPVDWYGRTLTGLRTALIIGVALIFVEHPTLTDKFDNGMWIMYAMIMSQADNLGATFAQMRLRLFGTFLGALFSYFVYIAVGVELNNQIAMFAPFILACGIVKQNKQWSYFGSISSTTAQIVTFGQVGVLLVPVGNYVLLRIQENAVGILLVFTISLATIPKLAIDILKLNHLRILHTASTAILKVWELYEDRVPDYIATGSITEEKAADIVTKRKNSLCAIADVRLRSTSLPPTRLKQHEQEMKALGIGHELEKDPSRLIAAECLAITTSLDEQPLLMDQCGMELLFWIKPFPRACYGHLYQKEKELLALLRCLDRTAMKISRMINLHLAEASTCFASRVKDGFLSLVEQILLTLRLSAQLVDDSLQIYKTIRSVPSIPTPEMFLDNAENGRSFTSPASQYSQIGVNDSRAEHGRRMEKLHAAMSHLSVTNARLVDWMHGDYLQDLLTHSHAIAQKQATLKSVSIDGSQCLSEDADIDSAAAGLGKSDIEMYEIYLQDVNSDANTTPELANSRPTSMQLDRAHENIVVLESTIHRLFSIQICFNAFFYSCHHLAFTVMDMSDSIFTLMELAQYKNHQPF